MLPTGGGSWAGAIIHIDPVVRLARHQPGQAKQAEKSPGEAVILLWLADIGSVGSRGAGALRQSANRSESS